VTATPQPPQAAVRLYLRAGLRSVTWRRETLFFQRIGSATLVQWPNSHASIKQPHPSKLNGCLKSRGRFRAVRRSTTLRNGLSPMIGRSVSPSPKLKSMSSRRGSAPSSQPSVDHQPAATSSPPSVIQSVLSNHREGQFLMSPEGQFRMSPDSRRRRCSSDRTARDDGQTSPLRRHRYAAGRW